jgi:hypothetical protein
VSEKRVFFLKTKKDCMHETREEGKETSKSMYIP